MNAKSVICLVVVSAVTLCSFRTVSFAQEVVGAKQALEQIRELAGKAAVSPPEAASKSIGEATRKLSERIGKLGPKAAAEAWLALFDEWKQRDSDAIDSFSSGDWTENSFAGLLSALPDPDAWAELSRQIDARRKAQGDSVETIALSLLGHRLVDDAKSVKADIVALDTVTAKKPAPKGGIASLIGRAFGSGADDWQREQLRSSVATLKAAVDPASSLETFREQLENFDPDVGYWLEVPDLARLTTPEEAEALLKKALLLKNTPLTFQDSNPFGSAAGSPTIELARRIVRANLAQVTTAHWELCYAIGTADLYEAFAKLDSESVNDNSAAAWYVADLIIQGRTKEVTDFLVSQAEDYDEDSLSASLFFVIDDSEHQDKLFAFLKSALTEHPTLPLWDTLVTLGARLGRSGEVLQLVEKTAQSKDLAAKVRRRVQRVRADSLLAADRVEDAVTLYFGILEPLIDDRSPTASDEKYEIATTIARIGHLLENDDWYQRSLKVAEAVIIAGSGDSAVDSDTLISLLIERREFARAEKLLIFEIARSAREGSANELDPFDYVEYGNSSVPLPELARLYHRAGRSEDVLTLLTTAPWWEHTDIGQFLKSGSNRAWYRGFADHSAAAPLPIALIAAAALAEAGRNDEARAIAEELVFHQPGLDAVWEMALKLTGNDFPKLAQSVFEKDAFEERPLIWLAQYHLDAKNIDQAEIEIRKAIAIDPSDGEQPRGDRMRAYAILAEILQAKGDAKTAEVFRGAVRAIRMAESADRFYSAGMLTRGIRMYRDSLTHFADAYCIQSRLAVQLAEQGDLDAAAVHYERAFQLMPDSFGRVESHCFGCEGVFQGEIAQDIAERVFARLRTEKPGSAQVHYLSGYLRLNQDRPTEAVAFFQKAVELDPDYLNAWSKLAEAHAESGEKVPAAERDNIAFNILRLDPSGKQCVLDVSQIQDLARLWRVLAATQERTAPRPDRALLELPAAKKRRNELANATGTAWDESDFMTGFFYFNRVSFAQHEEISAISSLLDVAVSQ